MNVSRTLLATVLLGCVVAESLHGSEIVLSNTSSDRFVDVLQYLADDSSGQDNASSNRIVSLEVQVSPHEMHVKSKKALVRNYNAQVMPQEKKELTYILHTLARNSWASIISSRSSLKKAGNKINHLHPLRFLMTIFTDEQLQADFIVVKRTDLIWKDFFAGLQDSLKQESQKDNMRSEFISDFANTIGIKESLIIPSIKNKNWKEFVNILADQVPRSGNTGRYDM